MVWCVPPLSPTTAAANAGHVGINGEIPDVNQLRIPVKYLANLLTAGDTLPAVRALERLLGYPMVRERVDAGQLVLHGWHCVIEDGEVHIFDVRSGPFVPASSASHSGTGPCRDADEDGDSPLFNEIDDSYGRAMQPRAGDTRRDDR